jgi:hypothetical protein
MNVTDRLKESYGHKGSVGHGINVSPYQLAHTADCASPDSKESKGARVLLSVFDGVIEAIEWNPTILEGDAWLDTAHEIADRAPNVYTHQLWQEFVDLAGYQEDISEYGEYGDDLNRVAGIALYMIAYRLASSLFQEAEGILSPE